MIGKKTFQMVALFTIVSFLISANSRVSHAAFIENYLVSPLLMPGMMVEYNVQFHPSVNFMRMEIVAVPTTTLILLNVTLVTLDHVNHSSLQLITVRGGSDDVNAFTIQQRNSDGTISVISLAPSTQIAVPELQFYINFPILSSYLQPLDYVNLDERKNLGTQVMSIGGDVQKYSFRETLVTTIQITGLTKAWEWDKATGLLINYQSSASYPYAMIFVGTNAWGAPYESLYKPLSPQVFITDIYLLGATIGGLYFSDWKLWLITAILLIIWISRHKVQKYFEDRKVIQSYPDMHSTLKKVNKQDKPISYVRVNDIDSYIIKRKFKDE